MPRSMISRLVLCATVTVLAGCQMSPDAMRSGGGLENSRPDAPRARTAQAIVLGQNNAIVVEEMNKAQYERHLTRLARKFQRQTDEVIFFDQGTATLSASARAALSEQAEWIGQHPEAFVSVTGYADDSTSARRNKELGLKRAREAVTFLVSQGVARDQMVALESGGTETFDDGQSNRRVVTEILELKDRIADRGGSSGTTQVASLSGSTDPGTNGGTGNGGTGNGGTGNGGGSNGGGNGGGSNGGGGTNGGGNGGGGTNGGTGGNGGDVKNNNGKKGAPPGKNK